MKNLELITPRNLGWLELKLDDKELKFLWDMINERGEKINDRLAGNIDSSYEIYDKGGWFTENVLLECGIKYEKNYGNIWSKVPITGSHPFTLSSMWVNYQKQYEFNPLHDHTGVFSFVIWMQIPTDYEDQKQISITKDSNLPVVSNFVLNYHNTLGMIAQHVYAMSKEMEGTMLFFPSQLMHCVYPFFNCNKDRISISGNLSIDTNRI
jgi:hypothetical protein|tara:strand:- start:45 stop:671 length:627 start_codon:yes stop_codon:yes gene_type:complete